MEAKYRAWDTVNKYWFDEHPIIDTLAQKITDRYDGAAGDFKRIALIQCIGLRDKNNAEIYDGYIINIRINRIDRGKPYTYPAVVFWNKSDYCWSVMSELHGSEHISWILDGFDGEWIEVIGNIYENPGLMGSINVPVVNRN